MGAAVSYDPLLRNVRITNMATIEDSIAQLQSEVADLKAQVAELQNHLGAQQIGLESAQNTLHDHAQQIAAIAATPAAKPINIVTKPLGEVPSRSPLQPLAR